MNTLLNAILQRKNTSRSLPVKPSRLIGFDGVNDYITIDSSNVVSNPFDFERNQPFTLAGIVYPNSFKNIRFFDKRTSNTGYVFGTTTDNLIFLGFNTTSGLQGIRSTSGFDFTIDSYTIFIATFSGNQDSTGIKIYQYKPNLTLSATFSVANGNHALLGASALSSTIKNTTLIRVGANFSAGSSLFTKAKLAHLSIWDSELNNSDVANLASRMREDTVSQHALFGSNCVGYWREFVSKAINAVNTTYNGTLNNF